MTTTPSPIIVCGLPKSKEEQDGITQKYLSELFDYNPVTGAFITKFDRKSWKAGTPSSCLNDKGYLRITLKRRVRLVHRLIWILMTGNYPKAMIDHINGNRSDNAFENLRETDKSGNAQNSKLRNDNPHGEKGVYLTQSGKWKVQLNHNQKIRVYGTFVDFNEAVSISREKRKELHGEYFRNN